MLFDPVPDIMMSTSHEGDVNPSLILDTSLATMTQITDLLKTKLCQSRRSWDPPHQAAEDGADGSFVSQIMSLGQALNLFVVTYIVELFESVEK